MLFYIKYLVPINHYINSELMVINGRIQGGITPIADSVMCMPVTVNFAT